MDIGLDFLHGVLGNRVMDEHLEESMEVLEILAGWDLSDEQRHFIELFFGPRANPED